MVHSASFQPPALPVTDSCRPSWILLDKVGYISDCVNATKAEATMSTGQTISVCFFTAEAPCVSYFSIHCPGLRNEDFVKEPTIVHAEDNVVLLSFSLTEDSGTEYFIYRAREGQQLLLEPLPALDRYLSKLDDLSKLDVICEASVAFVPYGGGEHFVLAALQPILWPVQYQLHIFRSELGTWTNKLLVFEKSGLGAHDTAIIPVKVIMLGGGEIGWVDLWEGILVCNVLEEDPMPRVIPLPMLLPDNRVYRRSSSRLVRDVICTDGLIKLVEMEYCSRPIIPQPRDVSDTEVLYDSELRLGDYANKEKITYKYLGWRIITWDRTFSSNCWRRGCLVHVDDIFVNNPSHHVLLPELVDKSARKKLITGFPTLSMDGRDVVYLMSKVRVEDQKAWVVAIDMHKKTVEKLAPYSDERFISSKPTYLQYILPKYLNTDSDGTQIAVQKGSSTLQASRFVDALLPPLIVAKDQAIHVKRWRDEEQQLKASCWCEKSSDEVLGCEHVFTSKRMRKKVGAFSKDHIADTRVTVCGVSKLDACACTSTDPRQPAPGSQVE